MTTLIGCDARCGPNGGNGRWPPCERRCRLQAQRFRHHRRGVVVVARDEQLVSTEIAFESIYYCKDSEHEDLVQLNVFGYQKLHFN